MLKRPLASPVASTLVDLSGFLGSTEEVSMDKVDGFLAKWGILSEGITEGERL